RPREGPWRGRLAGRSGRGRELGRQSRRPREGDLGALTRARLQKEPVTATPAIVGPSRGRAATRTVEGRRGMDALSFRPPGHRTPPTITEASPSAPATTAPPTRPSSIRSPTPAPRRTPPVIRPAPPTASSTTDGR